MTNAGGNIIMPCEIIDEGENVVVESKRTWLDTLFSLFALAECAFYSCFFLICLTGSSAFQALGRRS